MASDAEKISSSGQRRCFFITPIGIAGSVERKHADMLLEIAIKPLFEGRGYQVSRADLMSDPAQITSGIFEALRYSDMCVADLSFLNPNVLYELGVRHALQKAVIHIARDGTQLPFDNANQRTLFFDAGDIHSLKMLKTKMAEQLDRVENDPATVSNPLTHAIGRFEAASNGDTQAQLVADLLRRVETLEVTPPSTAPAFYGQGDIATKNVADLREDWRRDQRVANITWVSQDGVLTASYRGFSMTVSAKSKGRWASAATEDGTGFSVSYPSWQRSEFDAKVAIVLAVDEAIANREA